MAYKGLKLPGSLDEYTVLEIEHILPDNPDASLRQYFISQNPGIDYDEYKNRLGNLTLLEKPINIVAGNDFFQKKAAEYKKCKNYLTSSIAQINTVRLDGASIENRQDILMSLAREVWMTSAIPVDE
jgi:hypothetical protein